MKILQVMSRFNPKLGGGVDVVANLSKHMVKRGHEVTILTTDYKFDEEYTEEIKKEGVNVVTLKHVLYFNSFIYSPEMKKWLKNNIINYDIIHLNASRTYQNNIVHKYSCRYNIPYVLQCHGSVQRIGSYKKYKLLYDYIYGYKILRGAKKLIALNKKESADYMSCDINKNRIQILPNGIDLQKYDKLPEYGLFKKKYNIEKDTKIILYLGRLHETKGVDLILKSFLKLINELDNTILVMVGPDDGKKEELETYIKEKNVHGKIIFTGYVSENEKKMALIDSYVLITPRFYGFPIAFLESFACGLPVITTNEGDSLDWIHNYVGLITEYDENKLKNALLEIIIQNDLRSKFSDNAKNLVKNELNWTKISQDLEQLYYSALE